MSVHVLVSVNAIITNKENNIILVKLGRPQDKRGLWALPGGKVEEGESFEEALVREVFEETNISKENYQFHKITMLHDFPETTCKHIYHLQLNDNLKLDDTFKNEEILQIKNFDKDEILNINFRAPWVAPLILDFYSEKFKNPIFYTQK